MIAFEFTCNDSEQAANAAVIVMVTVVNYIGFSVGVAVILLALNSQRIEH